MNNKKIYYKSISSSTKDMILLAKKYELLELFDRYEEEFVDYRNITSLVHGDSNPSNYIFEKNKIKSIIDFDNLKYDNPVRDLAESIISFSIIKYKDNTSNIEKIFNPINIQIASSIIDGYKVGISNNDMYYEISKNLIPAIKLLILLYYSLAFLKNNKYKEKINLNILKLNNLSIKI